MITPNLPIMFQFRKHAFSKESVCAFLYNPMDSPPHKHTDFYEFTLVTYGEFKDVHNNTETICPKNSQIFFTLGEQHAIYATKSDSVHFSFIVKPDYFESKFAQYFPDKTIESLTKYRHVRLSERQGEYLNELAKRLKDHSNRGFDDYYIQLFLFTTLSFMLLNEKNVPMAARNPERYVDNLLIRLNNYTYVKHSVNQIYKDYPIAQSALITSFKKRTGMTIIQYHNIKKIEYAAQLFSSHEYTVTDVCMMLNYSSLPHFAKIFKEQYGMSPKRYQKLHSCDPIPQNADDILT